MNEISYNNLRLSVLDDFYQEMINHGQQNHAKYESIIGYLIYEYEEGFSSIEMIIIDFVIYIIAGKFVSEKISNKLKDDLTQKLNTLDFKLLLQLLNSDERTSFLHDLYLLKIINEEARNKLLCI